MPDLTVREAADAAKRSLGTVRTWLGEGRIPGAKKVRTGGQRALTADEAERDGNGEPVGCWHWLIPASQELMDAGLRPFEVGLHPRTGRPYRPHKREVTNDNTEG